MDAAVAVQASMGVGQVGGQEGIPEQGQQGMDGATPTLPTWKGRKRSRKARLASRKRCIRASGYPKPNQLNGGKTGILILIEDAWETLQMIAS